MISYCYYDTYIIIYIYIHNSKYMYIYIFTVVQDHPGSSYMDLKIWQLPVVFPAPCEN